MDASQYKDYVLFMLFIKYVSDKYGDSDAFAPPITIPNRTSTRSWTLSASKMKAIPAKRLLDGFLLFGVQRQRLQKHTLGRGRRLECREVPAEPGTEGRPLELGFRYLLELHQFLFQPLGEWGSLATEKDRPVVDALLRDIAKGSAT